MKKSIYSVQLKELFLIPLILLTASLMVGCGGSENGSSNFDPVVTDGSSPTDSGTDGTDTGTDGGDTGTDGTDTGTDGTDTGTDGTATLADFPVEVDFFNSVDPVLGAGYEKDFLQFKSVQCINGTETNGNAGSSEIQIEQNAGYEDIESSLSFSANGGIKLFGSAETNMLLNLRETSRTLTAATYAYNEFTSKVWVIGNDELLTPGAESVYENSGAFGIRQFCGSHYINQINRRSELVVSARLLFQTADQKATFKSKLDFAFDEIFSLSAAINALQNYSGGGVSIQFNTLLRGGDFSQLPSIIRSLNGDNLITCQQDGQNCLQILGDLNEAISSVAGPALTQGDGVIYNVVKTPIQSVITYLDNGALESYVSEESLTNRNALIGKYQESKASLNDIHIDKLSISNTDDFFEAEYNLLSEIETDVVGNINKLESDIAFCFENSDECTDNFVENSFSDLVIPADRPALYYPSRFGIFYDDDHPYNRFTTEIECSLPYGGQLTTIGVNNAYQGYVLGYKQPSNATGEHSEERFITCLRNADGEFDVYDGVLSTLAIQYSQTAPEGHVVTAVSSVVYSGNVMTALNIDYAKWNAGTRTVGLPILGDAFDQGEGSVRAPNGTYIGGVTLRPYDRSAGYSTVDTYKYLN